MDRRRAGMVVVLCLLLVVSHTPILAGLATAGHGSPVNATAVWGSNEPGATNVSLTAYASGSAETAQEGLAVWKNFTTIAPAAIGYSCTPQEDVRAAGVDRDNDDPGTETDETLIGKFKYFTIANNSADQTVLTIVFYDEDDFGGQSIHLNETDQLVAKFAGCWHTPPEPGWYRNYGHVNGTTWSGPYGETDSFSHWYYFCSGCESYDAAVATLGPPPETDLAHSDQSVGRMGGPYDLAETGTTNESHAGSGTPTRTATATPTATATRTTVRSTPTTVTTRSMGPSPTDPSTTRTDTPSTPTAGTTAADGVGFGGVSGALALLLAVVLATRRGF